MRNIIIGLSVVFLILSTIITIKSFRIPIRNVHNQKYTQEVVLRKDLQGKEEITEVSKKQKDSLKETIIARDDISFVQENNETQKVKQYNDTRETSSEMHKVSKRVIPTPDEVLKHRGKSTDISSKSLRTIISSNQNTSEKIYTIQTGSFNKIERAQKQYDSVAQVLNDKAFNYLRIEKIGLFYSVRIGKFNDHSKADDFFQEIESHLPSAVILKAYIKNNRIIKLNEISISSTR